MERYNPRDNLDFTHHKLHFAKLRRRINAYNRSGIPVDREDYIQMLKLDNKLSVEYPDIWRRNYEESKYIDKYLEAHQADQDAEQ